MINELPNLFELQQKRIQIRNYKCSEPILMNNEFTIHQKMINEYFNDYLINCQDRFNQLQFNLVNFENQPNINNEMRYLILEFISCCHTRLKLCTTTLFQTINIIDKFTSFYSIKNYNYQLVALVSLWIASKLYDAKRRIPTLKILMNLCCLQYQSNHFIKMELIILKCLNWDITTMSTFDTMIDLMLFSDTMKNDDLINLSIDNNLSINLNHYLTNSSSSTPSFMKLNINDWRTLSIMICELIYFNNKITMKYTVNEVVNCVLKIVQKIESNQFETNFNNELLINIIMNYLIKIMNNLPSSFKLKYGNDKLCDTLFKFITNFNQYKQLLLKRQQTIKLNDEMKQYVNRILDAGGNPTITTTTNTTAAGAGTNTSTATDNDTTYNEHNDKRTPNALLNKRIDENNHKSIESIYKLPMTPTTPNNLRKRKIITTHENDFVRGGNKDMHNIPSTYTTNDMNMIDVENALKKPKHSN